MSVGFELEELLSFPTSCSDETIEEIFEIGANCFQEADEEREENLEKAEGNVIQTVSAYCKAVSEKVL